MLHILWLVRDVNSYMMKRSSKLSSYSLDSTSFIGISQSKNKSQHETILSNLNRSTIVTWLVIILTEDAIKHMHVQLAINLHEVTNKSHTIHQHLFSDFSPICSSVNEKGKQGRMKGLTMVQCLNINRNNKSVLAHQ